MVIESRMIVGAAAAFALVGAVLWGSAALFESEEDIGNVEVVQMPERSWAVEVKELGAVAEASDVKRTAPLTASR